jgi:aspartate-semialdehyde dehydrogenase
MDPDVPLLIPEVNSEHMELINYQSYTEGKIITNPNCSTIGMVLALKPLLEHFGLQAVHVVTLQALSGAGYPGVPSLDIIDNVMPYIGGEEDKIETEPLKLFGKYENGAIKNMDLQISAQCNRVAVVHGHTECMSVRLDQKAEPGDLIQAWDNFQSEPQQLKLPTAPLRPTIYLLEEAYPQPKLHRNVDKGMATTIGRLQKCPVLDYKFVVLSHNTIRGAAGGAILNAEYLVKTGYVDGLEIPKA